MRLTVEQLVELRTTPLNGEPNRLRQAFELSGSKQIDSCAATGLSKSATSKLVRGAYSTLDIENARPLADYFGCTIEDLFPARAEAGAEAAGDHDDAARAELTKTSSDDVPVEAGAGRRHAGESVR